MASNGTFSFLAGGGEMGELVQAFDWSKTSLGDRSTWPLSLRNMLGVVLTSRFPMLLFWGHDLITFYNDAFRPSLGNNGKHPSSLGQRGEESWAESWPTIGPMINNIMAGGEAVWFEDQKLPLYRDGKMGYAYWTYSFSPVGNDMGEISGILVTCMETTKAVEGLQRIEENRHQLLSLFEHSPVAIAMLDKDRLTVKLANSFYCEIIDKKHDDIIGKPLLDVLPEMAGQGFDVLMANVISTGTPYTANEVPAQLVRTGQLETFYVNLAYNPVREPDGSISGVFVVATDVTAQVANRQRVEEDQRQLLSLFEQSPVGIAVIDRNNLTFRMANSFYGHLVDRKLEEIVDKPLLEALPEIAGQGFDALLKEVIATGIPFISQEVPAVIRRGEALETVYVNLAYQPMRKPDATVSGVLVVATDVTPFVSSRKAIEQSETRFRALIEEAPVATCLFVGPEMRVEVINAMMVEAWGKDFSVLNKPLIEALPELAGQPFMDLLATVYNTGEAYKGIAAPVDLLINGRLDTYYYDFTYKPLLNEAGNVWAIINVSINVTDRVLANKRLEESELKFRSLIEEAPFATALYEGTDINIAIANEAMIKLWGKTPAVVGLPLAKALPELEGQPFIPLLQEIFRTGETYQTWEQSADLVVDGRLQRFWFNFIYKPIFDESGKVYGVLNMAVDVSEQVAIRKQIEESNLFTRSIIDNSPIAKVVFTGADMIIATINRNMLQLLGRDERIIGKPFMEAIPELIPTALMARLQHVYATGETYVQPEERIMLLKNEVPYTGYYQYIYKALRNTAGEIYGIITTASEITAQVEARKKIEEGEKALRDAVELAELATWRLDLLNNQITYSARLQQWLGITSSVLDAEGSSRIHEKDRNRVQAAITKAIEPGGLGYFDEVYTIVNLQSGQERIIHANGSAVYDENKVAIALAGTAQDVTVQKGLQLALEREVEVRTEELAAAVEELRATNEELAEANTKLLHSNEELAQYAYVASHDLQEPLRKIRLFARILNDKSQSAEQVTATVEKIYQSTERMSLLIQDLLEFSRLLHSDSLMRPVDLATIVQGVIGDFELLVAEKEAQITVENLPVIEGISLQMNQLFYNLVGNALKFASRDRKPVITISSRIATEKEIAARIDKQSPDVVYQHITVADNGIGFDPVHFEKIFEVFKRLHGRQEYGGSGIGLAICRRVVQNHKGSIYAEAQLGAGARFHILLPEKQLFQEHNQAGDFNLYG